MAERIAVETLTLNEISDLFQRSLEIAYPRARGALANKMKKLARAKVSNHKWVQSYEIFKGAKLNFYCLRVPKESEPYVNIGMTHRTPSGLILIGVDLSNGGTTDRTFSNMRWDKWVNVYTTHFCERYAERIMKVDAPTFKIGSDGIMFPGMAGVVRITDTIAEGIEEIEFQFKDGLSFGYRDTKNKIVYFKTVYSNDMLKGDRLAFREEWKESISEVYEMFKRG